MFNDRIRLTANSAVDFLIKLLLGAAGIALLGGISIPLQDEVDLTLQTLMVLLPAVLFGWEVGLGAVVLYIVVGGLGVPIFPGGGSGFDRILEIQAGRFYLSPVGGFYFGFALAALLAGYAVRFPQTHSWTGQVLVWVLAHLVIRTVGYGWLASVVWKPAGLDLWSQFTTELTSKVPSLVVKSALGVLAVIFIQRGLTRTNP